MRWPTICWVQEKSGRNLFTKRCVVEVPSSKGERGLSTLGGVGKGKIQKGVLYHAMIAKRKPMIKTLIYWFPRSDPCLHGFFYWSALFSCWMQSKSRYFLVRRWASACLQSRLLLVASNHCASEIKYSWAKFYLNISTKFNQNKCHVELFVSALCICDWITRAGFLD